MPTYKVAVPIISTVEVIVDAVDADEAVEVGYIEAEKELENESGQIDYEDDVEVEEYEID